MPIPHTLAAHYRNMPITRVLLYIYSLWLCDADQANNGNNVRPPSLTSRLMTSVSAYKDAH